MATLADIKAVLEKILANQEKQRKPSPGVKSTQKEVEKGVIQPAAEFGKVWQAMGRPLDNVVDRFKQLHTILQSIGKALSFIGKLGGGTAKAITTGVATAAAPAVGKAAYNVYKDIAKIGKEGFEHAKPESAFPGLPKTVADILKESPVKGQKKTRLASAIGLQGQPLDPAAAEHAENVAKVLSEFPVKGTKVTKIAPAIGKFGQPLGEAAKGLGGIAGEEGTAVIAETAGMAAGAGEAVAGAGAGLAGAGEAAAGAAAVGAGAAEAGGMLAGLGGVGAALASNPVGWIVAGVAAVAAVVTELALLPFQLRDFGKSVVDSQKELAEFSGSMAQVFAQREVFEAMQGMRVGEARAESTGRLETAYEGLSTALEPITNLLTNWFNTGLANLLEIVTTVVEIFNIVEGPIMIAAQLYISTIGKIGEALEQANRTLREIRGFINPDENMDNETKKFLDNTIPKRWRQIPRPTSIALT
jgi:hypothetical protein